MEEESRARASVPRQQMDDLSHHLDSDAETNALLLLLNPQMFFKPKAAPRVVVDPVTLAVMWPKRGCRSAPPLPAYGVSIPTLLHASTRGKFSPAG